MNANFHMGVHVEVDDPMFLQEKVMEFAKANGWQGEVVTLGEALACKERNMADYMSNFQQAQQFMNDNYAPSSSMGSQGGAVWKASAEQYKWGLCDPNDENNPFDDNTEAQVGGLTINDKESEEPSIQQTN